MNSYPKKQERKEIDDQSREESVDKKKKKEKGEGEKKRGQRKK